MGETCSTHGEIKVSHKICLVELRRQVGRPRRRWEDNIKMEIGLGCVDWINVAQDMDRWRALVNTVMTLRVS